MLVITDATKNISLIDSLDMFTILMLLYLPQML
jgi:hypothetical protein